MSNSNKKILTNWEYICTIVASLTAVGLLSLPSSTAKITGQDAWISVFIGSLYPLYIVFVSSIITKNYPNNSIMDLSKKFLGKIFGNFLNFLFALFFLFYSATVICIGNNLLMVFGVWFLTPLKLTTVYVILVVFGCYKGLKTLAKINVIAFFIQCALVSTSLVAFFYGSFLNFQPVFGSGFGKILKASETTMYAFSTIEAIPVLHIYIMKKEKTTKLSLISFIIVLFFYSLVVFTSLLYMGPDIAMKSFWPFYLVTESVRLRIITNFRFILMIFWPLIIFRTIATEYAISALIMDGITGVDYRKWCIYMSPIIFILPLFFKNIVQMQNFNELVVPGLTIFAVFYVTLISIIVFIRSKFISPPKKNR